MWRWRLCVVAVMTMVVVTAACQGRGDHPSDAVEAVQRVESPSLGIALAGLPDGVEVAENVEGELRLTAEDGVSGDVVIDVVVPESGGVNLVAEVQAHRREVEARGGTYHGSQELMTQHGPAFTSRGSWLSDDGPVEALHVYALHPSGDRMVRLVTRYAPDEDASSRAQTMLALLGELEMMTPTDGQVAP